MAVFDMAQGELMDRSVHIIASPFKTATSSVAQALVMLGVGYAPMPYRGDLVGQCRAATQKTRQLARDSVSFDGFAQAHGHQVIDCFGELMQAAAPFEIFHDAPLGHSHIHPFVLKVLMPNARFIWVKRPKKAWLDSVRNWEITHPNVYPNHPKWESDTDAMIAEKMRRRRRARNEFSALRRAFPRDTLVMEWSDLDDFETLAAFYGVDPPAAPFPHNNKFGQNIKEC